MLYAKDYYKHDYCLKKAKELRKTGKYKKVRVGNTIIDDWDNEKNSKIYVYEKEEE